MSISGELAEAQAGLEGVKTMIMDLVGLPDPSIFSIGVRAYNNDTIVLYFQLDAETKTGWTFTPTNLGSVSIGANIYFVAKDMASRDKPSGALEETVTFLLKAYTDAGYSNLKFTTELPQDFIFIDSSEMSLHDEDDFDDATVMGWDKVCITAPIAQCDLGTSTAVFLSAPRSLEHLMYKSGSYELYGYIFKEFTTPSADRVFAIINIDAYDYGGTTKEFRKLTIAILIDAAETILYQLGQDAGSGDRIHRDKWLKLVVSLPAATTLTIRIYHKGYSNWSTVRLYLDNFKIVYE